MDERRSSDERPRDTRRAVNLNRIKGHDLLASKKKKRKRRRGKNRQLLEEQRIVLRALSVSASRELN